MPLIPPPKVPRSGPPPRPEWGDLVYAVACFFFACVFVAFAARTPYTEGMVVDYVVAALWTLGVARNWRRYWLERDQRRAYTRAREQERDEPS